MIEVDRKLDPVLLEGRLAVTGVGIIESLYSAIGADHPIAQVTGQPMEWVVPQGSV